MNTTIGTSQASLSAVLSADTSLHNYYVTRFISVPIYQSSVAANTWTYAFAATPGTANANWPVLSTNKSVWVNCYVWRPSNNSLVGTILDGNTAATVDEGAVSTEVYHIVTFSGSAVTSVQNGDVIIFEVWFKIQQSVTASATACSFQYDGTTVSAENATASSAASYLETPETLVLTPPVTIPMTVFVEWERA